MANEFDVVGTESASDATNTDLDSIKAASKAFGPKRVETPNIKIEQFDPITVQKAVERQNSVWPTLPTIGVAIGTPSRVYGRCNHYRKPIVGEETDPV